VPPALAMSLLLHAPDRLEIETIADLCERIGLMQVELDATLIEAWMGAPAPLVSLSEPPRGQAAIEAGLIDLEEEVLIDELAVSKHAHDARMRLWRQTSTMATLIRARRLLAERGVHVAAVRWHGLAGWSAPEIRHACRTTESLGAQTVVTAGGHGPLARLATCIGVHGLCATIDTPPDTWADVFSPRGFIPRTVGIGLSVWDWTHGRHERLRGHLLDYGLRVTHVRVPTDWFDIPDGEQTLLAMLPIIEEQASGQPVPVIVEGLTREASADPVAEALAVAVRLRSLLKGVT
jgi:hypothetical protein